MRFSLCLLFFAISIPAIAGDVPEKVLRYARESERQRMKLIEDLETSSNGAIRTQPTDTYRKLIDPFETYFGTMDILKLTSMGSLGRIAWGEHSIVLRVVDAENAIINIGVLEHYRAPNYYLGKHGTIKHVRYQDRTRVQHTPIWVTGMSTTGMVDGSEFQPDEVFQGVGTEMHDTAAGGSRTITKVARFDIYPYENLFTLKHTARVWSDKSGAHEIRALFIAYKRGIVLLKTPGGEEKKIKLSALCKEDQKFVRDKLRGKRH